MLLTALCGLCAARKCFIVASIVFERLLISRKVHVGFEHPEENRSTLSA